MFLDFVEKLVQRLRSVGAVTKTTFGRRIVNCAILLTASIAFAGAENGLLEVYPSTSASPWSRSTAPFETQIGISTFVSSLEGDFGMKNRRLRRRLVLRHSKRIFEKSIFRS